ncbi:MAG: hypothetical protein GQ531_07430 [Sulfurovum sp.]|nr:hypothetical protein [Sulfurovum sp.]
MMTNNNTKHDNRLEPESMVGKYYHALYSGDLQSVKEMMTEESYIMTLEPFSIKLSFHDPVFKTQWDQIEESKDALDEVEKKISKELLSRNLSPQIEITNTEQNGLERMIVHYTKDGKNKKLYFSKSGSDWRINYFAGRPVKPGYLASIKNWMLSILPKIT